MPALVAVLAGILVGLALGGSFATLATLKLQWEWLILPLFLIQAVARGRLLGFIGASQWSAAVWVVASLALVGALLLNLETPGMLLGAGGVLMNLDVVLLNACMPVVIEGRAATDVSLSTLGVVKDTGGFYRIAQPGDMLVWLGDTIPFKLGDSLTLVSPGDVVLMVAVAVVIMYGMTRGNSTSASVKEA